MYACRRDDTICININLWIYDNNNDTSKYAIFYNDECLYDANFFDHIFLNINEIAYAYTMTVPNDNIFYIVTNEGYVHMFQGNIHTTALLNSEFIMANLENSKKSKSSF